MLRGRLAASLWVILIASVLASGCATNEPAANETSGSGTGIGGGGGPEGPEEIGYRVVRSYLHDEEAFTQGLVYRNGTLYEGTGLYGRSSLRRVDLATGAVLERRDLEGIYFGEGVALVGDRLVQLTWRNHVGFVYDAESLDRLSNFTYPTEGWGITYDGTRLVMSDGSATLYFLDPKTFEVAGSVEVRGTEGPVTRLNELEWVDGSVYANVWLTDTIVRIDPMSGAVTGTLDMTGLLPMDERDGTEDVLNGIAYDEASGHLLLTGKLWPKLFEIELVDRGR